jgi:hypothetical protein
MGDLIGLTLLLCETAILAILNPYPDIPFWAWVIPYAILAISAVLIWHGKAQINSYLGWFRFIAATVACGAVFFALDILSGHLSHPEMPFLDAGRSVGGIVGYGLTLILFPGMTMVGTASLIRCFFITQWKKHD